MNKVKCIYLRTFKIIFETFRFVHNYLCQNSPGLIFHISCTPSSSYIGQVPHLYKIMQTYAVFSAITVTAPLLAIHQREHQVPTKLVGIPTFSTVGSRLLSLIINL